jgi:hypothetical protein
LGLPDFFLIGAMKAGTTSIHRYLAQHPELFLSDVKEPNYFWLGDLPQREVPPKVRSKSITDRAEYEKLFDAAGPGQLRGESSTSYLSSRRAAERIAALRPDARLIAILRDPAERAWSHFVSNRERGDDPYDDFSRALVEEDVRRERDASGYRFEYRWKGFYSSHLGVYDELFPSDRICVVLYEDLVERAGPTLQKIYAFLGVDPHFEPDMSLHYNVSGVARHPTIAWALRRADSARDPVVRRLPPPVVSRIGRWLRRQPQALDPAIRRDLVEGYREDIRLLEARIGRDLGSWLR